MKMFWIILSVAAVLILLALITAYICFRMAFYVNRKKQKAAPEFDLPPEEIYRPYHDKMREWMKETSSWKYKRVYTTSFDGLKLSAKYYEANPGGPIEVLFHGYRGTAERDLCGGMQRCFSLGRNALIVDQRGAGESGGSVISFGINESRDALSWIDYINENFGKDTKIILGGISMGAATVMITAGKELPENVIAVLADCGYTSARDIIKKTIREMGLPATVLYPFVRLGAKIYGRFNLEETSPVESLKNCRLPIIFFHGEDDSYVPCEMSRINYEACASPKKLVTMPGAGHGMCYLIDREGYLQAIADFYTENGIETKVVK